LTKSLGNKKMFLSGMILQTLNPTLLTEPRLQKSLYHFQCTCNCCPEAAGGQNLKNMEGSPTDGFSKN
jgi:hypothetical protein